MTHDNIKIIPYRGAREFQYKTTRPTGDRPEQWPHVPALVALERHHDDLWQRYMDEVASGNFERAATAARIYRIAIMGGE